MADQQAQSPKEGGSAPTDHLNIKVTDNNNEVFFKIKRSTQLKKLMDAFCERQGKQMSTVRFLFDGARVRPEDTPDTVCTTPSQQLRTDPSLSLPSPFPAQAEDSVLTLQSSWRWTTVTRWKFTRSRSEARRIAWSMRSVLCFFTH